MSANGKKRGEQLYLASPLFSDAEKEFNLFVAARLEKHFNVFLPQRDGGLLSRMIEQGVPIGTASSRIFELDIDAIRHSSCVVAVLDGRSIDEGVAFELGVAYAFGIRCWGLQTDCRRLAPWGNNPMIDGALESTFRSVDDLEAHVRELSNLEVKAETRL